MGIMKIDGIKVIGDDQRPYVLIEGIEKKDVLKAMGFHKSIGGYSKTPLVRLKGLAKKIKVQEVFVKDESFRFGLNSFKALGGTYAIACLLCEKLNLDISEVDFNYFKKEEVKEKIKDMVFITATDGNHGKGVAWAANQLGCKSVVFMPKGSSESRVEAIQNQGASVLVTEMNYDDAVRHASEVAEKNNWILVQDTAWIDYEKIPWWIVQGYSTLAEEALEQLKTIGYEKPTHVFLQAGVGSFAGAILGYYVNRYEGKHPITIIVESDQADCIFKSMEIGDGKPHLVKGDLNTIMAGLACGEPSTITWPILRDYANHYVSCSDYISAEGVRILASPYDNDSVVIAGESGSVGIGLLSLIMEKKELEAIKNQMRLDESSVILCFNTEGATDPESYDKIVKENQYPCPF